MIGPAMTGLIARLLGALFGGFAVWLNQRWGVEVSAEDIDGLVSEVLPWMLSLFAVAYALAHKAVRALIERWTMKDHGPEEIPD